MDKSTPTYGMQTTKNRGLHHLATMAACARTKEAGNVKAGKRGSRSSRMRMEKVDTSQQRSRRGKKNKG